MKHNQWLIEQYKQQERIKQKLQKALDTNVPELYACFGKVLIDEKGMDVEEFAQIVQRTKELWNEYADTPEITSMIKWCEEVTGVEIANE